MICTKLPATERGEPLLCCKKYLLKVTDLVAKKYLHWHRTSVKIKLLGLFLKCSKMFDKKALKKEKTNTRKTLLLKKTPTCSTSQVSKEERGKYCCGLPFNVNIASSQ